LSEARYSAHFDTKLSFISLIAEKFNKIDVINLLISLYFSKVGWATPQQSNNVPNANNLSKGPTCNGPLPRACWSASSIRLLVRPTLFGDGHVLTSAFPSRAFLMA
ncbi:hypothetical protein T07_8245, partial [Trichinella nelsoni]